MRYQKIVWQFLLGCALAFVAVFHAYHARAEDDGAHSLTALTCLLQPNRSAYLGSDKTGIVAEVAVRRADRVKRGALLLRLDDRIERADLAKAKVARDVARDRLERAEELTVGRVISPEELADLRAEAAIAEADYQRAQIQLERVQIVAPFDGVVAEVTTETGELTGAEPLMRLIDTSVVKAELVFSVELYGQIARDDLVNIEVPLTGAILSGPIVAIDSFIDASSNSFIAIAELPNPDQSIPTGTSCVLNPAG